MIVEEAAKLIAQRIGRSYPSDKKIIFSHLDLIAEHIWASGLFKDSTKWTYVSVGEDNKIISPDGYDVLLGVNINFKPITIRDSTFLFHSNGPAEAPIHDNYFYRNVIDLGRFPVNRLIDNLCNVCSCDKPKCYYIGAKILNNCGTPPKTRIYGKNEKGDEIFTYKVGEKEEVNICSEEDADVYEDAIQGVEIKLSERTTTPKILFSKVTSIVKEPSNSYVEYYAIDSKTKVGVPIAKLSPFDIVSSYRLYQVPSSCVKKRCVFALFKMTKPSQIIDESQPFITDNKNAILSIAMGLDYKFNQGDLEKGETFLSTGIRDLAIELKEDEANTKTNIQFQKFKPRFNF